MNFFIAICKNTDYTQKTKVGVIWQKIQMIPPV